MTGPKTSDKAVDKTIEDSFPASDPPASSGTTGPGSPASEKTEKRGVDAIPTGHPNSDRHATETAFQWENEEKGIDAQRDLSEAEGSKDRLTVLDDSLWPTVPDDVIEEARASAGAEPCWIVRQGNGHIVVVEEGPGSPDTATGDISYIAEVGARSV
jgi:hypothetical protein